MKHIFIFCIFITCQKKNLKILILVITYDRASPENHMAMYAPHPMDLSKTQLSQKTNHKIDFFNQFDIIIMLKQHCFFKKC